MRCVTRICLTLAVLAACLVPCVESWAKGGRGGFKGGRGGSSKGASSFRDIGGGNNFRSNTMARGKRNNSLPRNLQHDGTADFSNGRNQPWSKHHAREQRRFDQRRQVADRLRELSDQNGNEQLRQVADDMDLQAQSHYDKQMNRIGQKYGLDGAPGNTDGALNNLTDASADTGDALNSDNNALGEARERLTGRENAMTRQIRNEQRKLAKRMEAVDRMRQLAGQSGDQGMLQEADRLDQWASNHFDQRMAQITNFEQRHGLTEVSQALSR